MTAESPSALETLAPGLTIDDDAIIELTRRVLAEYGDAGDPEFFGAMYDAGLAWVHWPRGLGGLGAPPSLQERIDEVLEDASRRPDRLRNPMGIGISAPAILAHGTDEQRERYLRRIFTAEDIWCQLFSEPRAGSDVATLATRAVKDGDDWVITGQKVWTSVAHISRYGLLLARTDPNVPKHAGITAFVLNMHSPGIEIRPIRQMNGDAHFNEVFLTDVRVPDTDRLGPVGCGWAVAMTTLMNERATIGGTIESRGTGDIAFALNAWNRPHTMRTAVQRDELARLWIEAEVLRLGKLRAMEHRHEGEPGPEDSILKLGFALLAQHILSFAVDVLGADGMLVPTYGGPAAPDDLVRQMLFVQAHTIAGGTSDIMRNILGERVLRLPVEPRADKTMPWRDIPRGR